MARKNGVWLDAARPRIKDLTLAELQQFDLGTPQPGSDYARAHPLLKRDDGERMPTLEEVAALASRGGIFFCWSN